MCRGGNLNESDAAGTGNVSILAKALPALRNLENHHQPSSKIVNNSEKDSQLPIIVG